MAPDFISITGMHNDYSALDAKRYMSLDEPSESQRVTHERDAVANKTERMMKLQTINDEEWRDIFEDLQEYKKENDVQKIDHVRELILHLFPDEEHIDIRTLTRMALLFAADKVAFTKENIQCLFEHAESDEGMKRLQLQNLLDTLDHLESQSSNPQIRYQLHIILDFIIQCIELIEMDAAREIVRSEKMVNPGNFRTYIGKYSDQKRNNVSNYLLSRKHQDIYELINKDVVNKPGKLHGVEGGNADASFYAITHAALNYELRTAFDYYHGYPNRNPLLPIAPGYLAEYKNGDIMTVFEQPKEAEGHLMQELIDKNNPIFANEIYSLLNTPIELLHGGIYRDHKPLSADLNKLKDIWAFRQRLKENGETFIYDLSKIETSKLHPLALSQLISYNNETLKRHWNPAQSQLTSIGQKRTDA